MKNIKLHKILKPSYEKNRYYAPRQDGKSLTALAKMLGLSSDWDTLNINDLKK